MSEYVNLMEPMMPEDHKHVLEDLATELIGKAHGLAGRLHPTLRNEVGELVRSMNCYYSNLIEGHNTTPIDIDRALSGNYAQDKEKRNLQYEALAHIEVQRMIDAGEAPKPVVSKEFILWVHKEFCDRLPDDLLWVENPDSGEKKQVIPGQLREDTVAVGRLVPPNAESLERFLNRFEEAYDLERLSKLKWVFAVAASHHRLLWIHPFLDGNGRVARLFSHALLLETGIGSSLWSVSRGLARNVGDYRRCLETADQPRRGDLDGRGSLSLAGLEQFCAFFLEACIDQVSFMEKLLEPTELLNRMEIYTEEEIRTSRLPKGSWTLLREAVIAGEFARGKAEALTGYKERQARKVLNTLIDRGLLISPTTRSPVRLGFPTAVVERWFPRLYPGVD